MSEEQLQFKWVPGQKFSAEDLKLDDEPEVELSEEQKAIKADMESEVAEQAKKAEEWRKKREAEIKADPNYVPYKSVGEAVKARDIPNFLKMMSMRGVTEEGNHLKNAEEMELLHKLIWHVAANGFQEFVEPLAKFGADLNRNNTDGIPPFMEAAGNGHVEMMKELVKHGVKFQCRSTGGGNPLLAATSSGHVEAVKYMIEELGYPVDANDLRGYTPLVLACSKDNEEMVVYLLSKGANPDHEVIFDDGATPDCYAESDHIANLVEAKREELKRKKGLMP